MPNRPNLSGQFINLRPLSVDDAEITFGWRHSERAKWLNKGAETVEAQAGWIAGRPSSEYNFIIEMKDGARVGMLSLIGVNPVNRHAEPARFLIGDEASVRGAPVAVEAMKLLYEFAFDTLGLNRLFGTVVAGNSMMAKWQKYLGMRQEGVMREHYFIDGKLQDAIMFGLLASDYRAVSLPRMTALITLSNK